MLNQQTVLLSMWALVGLVMLAIVWWTIRRNNTFSALDFITTDGHGDPAKLAYTGAFLISTWGLWVLIEQGKLTEYYFVCYIGGFVGGGAYVGTRNKYRAPEPDDPPRERGKATL